jgi:hypothetical protein
MHRELALCSGRFHSAFASRIELGRLRARLDAAAGAKAMGDIGKSPQSNFHAMTKAEKSGTARRYPALPNGAQQSRRIEKSL